MADNLTENQATPFVFTDEHDLLRRVVRDFCADHADEVTVRGFMESPMPFDQKAWTRLGCELGVLGLGVPEELGGSGGGIVDAAIVVEELGAALFCGPVFGTLAMAIPALVAAPDSALRAEILGAVADGSRTAAFADSHGAGDAAALVGVEAGDGWSISGSVEQVVDATTADDLLVTAISAEGLALFVVASHGPGVHHTPLTTLDQTRPQASLRLERAPARLLARGDDVPRICERAEQVGAVLLAAEQVGGAQRVLDMSVAYAKERLQFGRRIGSFQAVKHRLADMFIEVEHARSAAYYAAWCLEHGVDWAPLVTSIAQSACSAAYVRVTKDAIQVHGGIGFTWEHPAHLYFKRAFTDASLLGSAEQHRERIAALVLDTAAPEDELVVAVG